MISLGLDPSLTGFGYAVRDGNATGRNRLVTSGVLETAKTDVFVTRLMEIRLLVDRIINQYDPEVVGIESPAFDAGVFQTSHFCIMQYSLETIFKNRKDVVLFDPSTLKSLVRGDASKTGMITKNDVLNFMKLDINYPVMVKSDESDAYAVSYFANRFFQFIRGNISVDELSDNERRIFAEKTKKIKTLRGPKLKQSSHQWRENDRWFRFSAIPENSTKLPKKQAVLTRVLSLLGTQDISSIEVTKSEVGSFAHCISTGYKCELTEAESNTLISNGAISKDL